MSIEDGEINVAPVILILVVTVIVVRYYFFAPSQQAGDGGAGTATSSAVREQAAQHILQIFPHADRRSVLWDLERTGGNISATTERLLGGHLATPPITFQPPLPPRADSPDDQSSQAASSAAESPGHNAEPNLITQYKLQEKLAGDDECPASSAATGKPGVWCGDKRERQSNLKQRQENMILAARRKMKAKLAAAAAAADSSPGPSG